MTEGKFNRIITFVPKVSGYTILLRFPDLCRLGNPSLLLSDGTLGFHDNYSSGNCVGFPPTSLTFNRVN